MERRDILLWPDGFWCFVDELHADMLRGHDYRILEKDSPEWLETSSKPAIPLAK